MSVNRLSKTCIKRNFPQLSPLDFRENEIKYIIKFVLSIAKLAFDIYKMFISQMSFISVMCFYYSKS